MAAKFQKVMVATAKMIMIISQFNESFPITRYKIWNKNVNPAVFETIERYAVIGVGDP